MTRIATPSVAAARLRGSLIVGLALWLGGCDDARPAGEMETFKRGVDALTAIEHWNAANVGKALSTRLIKTSDNGASTSFEAQSGTLAGRPLRAVELRCLDYYPDECLLIAELAEPGPLASEFAKRFWPHSQPELVGSHKLGVAWSQQEGRNKIIIGHDVDGKQIASVVIDRILPRPHPIPEHIEQPLPPLPPQPPTSPMGGDTQVPGELIAAPDSEAVQATNSSR
ncbi:hypothetical protein K4L06_17750 [Lysobacter sp. BMK333-48F3]|uniref:hypothetical protein n=1 Tax=Lysobacter sp. BMK333-48F3 TaxID=2867962 RepID=UPI001C8BE4F5|nr:hypothetical protein [Lysobacter sp. BMK333-48F3]MBX9403157.1 hypothetical protein [Lysobacter sp. BMK333-48F3]